jgi:hypothetical protein
LVSCWTKTVIFYNISETFIFILWTYLVLSFLVLYRNQTNLHRFQTTSYHKYMYKFTVLYKKQFLWNIPVVTKFGWFKNNIFPIKKKIVEKRSSWFILILKLMCFLFHIVNGESKTYWVFQILILMLSFVY